jgi:phosphoglycolate phosphatase
MSERYDPALFRQTAIAFDLDGTLVDTAPDLVRALNDVIEPRGIEAVPLDDVRAMVGRGAKAMIRRAYERVDSPIEDAELSVLFEAFIASYHADIAAKSRVFPGVVETLNALKAAGANLSVCTNKPSTLADALIGELGLHHYFSRIIGPERTRAKKPAADHLMSALGSSYQRGALVGDSQPDVDSARAAGIPSIIMSYGYSERPADSLGADRVIHAFRDVPEALIEIWRQSS